VREYTLEAGELLAGDVSHRLPEAWRQFKERHPRAQLSAFDGLVDELHQWWEIRYPGFPGGQAVQISFSLVKVPRPVVQEVVDGELRPVKGLFHLSLEEMDEFFAAIAPLDYTLHAVRLAVQPSSRELGMVAYEEENLHRLW
jgi:hypothetical protein